MTAIPEGGRSIDQVASYLASSQLYLDAGATKIQEGAMCCALTATGYGVRAGTASTGAVLGVAAFAADPSSDSVDGTRSVDLLNGLFWRENYATHPVTQAHRGLVVFAVDDQTLSSDSTDGPVAGICVKVDSTQGVLVYINEATNYLLSQATLEADLASTANGNGASKIGLEDVGAYFDTDNVEAALQQIIADLALTTATHGANMVGFQDSGDKTTAATVDAALDEIYVDLTSAYAYIDVPFDASWFEVDGTALAAFADGVSTTPGLALDNAKAAGIRWNNDAAPDPICKVIPLPWDMDESADAVATITASKSGATEADAVTFDLGVYNNVVGALADADANYGGATSAMTGNATAKTVQAVTRTLALANLPNPDAACQSITVTVQPTDGTLGTDDVTAHTLRIRYTRKLRTS